MAATRTTELEPLDLVFKRFTERCRYGLRAGTARYQQRITRLIEHDDDTVIVRGRCGGGTLPRHDDPDDDAP